MTDESAFVAIARRYLALARASLDMELAWVAEVAPRAQIVRAVDGAAELLDIAEGVRLPLHTVAYEAGACDRFATIVGDVERDVCPPANLGYPWSNVGAFASAPIRLINGRLYGTLSCVSRAPRRDLGASDKRLLAALAGALGEEIAVFAARAAVRDARRAEIEQVIAGSGLNMVAQPIVRLDTMLAVGVEALSRFDAPPFRPDRWFADAAALGIGLPLELAAVRKGLQLLDHLPDDSYVSVNASPSAIASGGLRDAIADVDASRVVVEVTEHHSVSNYPELRRHLTGLRAMGARIAVDDAGAGYASFRHILNLRPDIIKLDRDLISGVGTDSARQALVGALIQFASGLGSVVVAEGIETAEELASVVGLGVSLGQGYFIARPSPLPMLELVS